MYVLYLYGVVLHEQFFHSGRLGPGGDSKSCISLSRKTPLPSPPWVPTSFLAGVTVQSVLAYGLTASLACPEVYSTSTAVHSQDKFIAPNACLLSLLVYSTLCLRGVTCWPTGSSARAQGKTLNLRGRPLIPATTDCLSKDMQITESLSNSGMVKMW